MILTKPTASTFRVLFATLLAFLVTACGGSGGSSAPAGPTLQSIEVSTPRASIAAGTSAQFTATGIYSDASHRDLTATVTWQTSDGAVAVVDTSTASHGRVRATAVGDVTVTAVLGDVRGTFAMTVTAAVLASLEVTPTQPTLALGTNRRLRATGVFSDTTTQDLTEDVTWTSSAPAVVGVATTAGQRGLVTAVAKGTATVQAAFDGLAGTTAVHVTDATLTSLEVTPTQPDLPLGTLQPFVATGIFTDGSHQDLTDAVTWSSSNAAIVAIASDGSGHATALGTATIDAERDGVHGTTVVTVTAATLVSIGVTPTAPDLPKGLTTQLVATGVYTDSTMQDLTTDVTWFTSDAGVAPVGNGVGSAGLLTGTSEGEATIRAVLGTIEGSTTVTVTPPVLTTIEVTPTDASTPLGLTEQFTAVGIYSDLSSAVITDTVTWSSSAPGVATVDNADGSEGLATTVATGSTTVEARIGTVAGQTTFTVAPAALVSIEVNPANPDVPLGLDVQLSATGIYTDTTTQDLTDTVTWSSTATGVATVSNAGGSAGLATTLAVGTTTVAATLASVQGSTTLTVTAAELVSIAVTPTLPDVPLGLDQQLTAIGTYSDSTTQDLTDVVAWASDGAAVAVSNAPGSAGLATALALGSAMVSAASAGIEGSTQVTVTDALLQSIEVTPDGDTLPAGSAQDMLATGYYSDGSSRDLTSDVTWATQDTGVAAISNAPGSEGQLTAVAVGTTQISATRDTVSGSATVTVTNATLVSIAIAPATPTIAAGGEQQFTAEGTYTDGSHLDLTDAVTWSSTNTAVATISNLAGTNGLATGAGAGSTTIGAALGSVSATADLTVTGVALTSITIDPVDSSLAKDTAVQFTATGHYSDGSSLDLTTVVTWSADDIGVVTTSNAAGSEGIVTAVGVGATVVRATSAGVSGATNVEVADKTLVSIAVTPADPTIAEGDSQTFAATGTFSDGSHQDLTISVTWQSSSNRVATTNGNGRGVVKAHQSGTATISATLGAITGQTTLTVVP